MKALPFGLPPEEAVKLFKAKGYDLRESFDWRDVSAETHAAAFTVAKSAGFDILNDVYNAVLEAQEGRLTPKEFAAKLRPALEAKGWWGKKEAVDPKTGQKVMAQLGSSRRLQVIYGTNLKQAQAAGRWAAIQANKGNKPYLRYVCIMDGKTRAEHKKLHGLILPVDDPFWQTWHPPNGWNCRCYVMALDDEDLRRYGWRVSKSAPRMPTARYRNERTGEVADVPQGIDPSFAHNPGGVALDVHTARIFGEGLGKINPKLAARATAASADFVARAVEPGMRAMLEDAQNRRAGGKKIVVGALRPEALEALERGGAKVKSGAIVLHDKVLQHALRPSKSSGGRALPEAEFKLLPYRLASPEAILRDRADGKIIYVWSGQDEPRKSKVVVELDADVTVRGADGKKKTARVTNIVTAGLVEAFNINAGSYEVLYGKIF